MDGSTYVKAQLMIDGLHGKLREIDCFPAQPPCSAKEFEEAPISSRWQELRAKFKAVESQTSSAIPLSPLSHSAMNNTNNYKTDRRFDSMTSPILKKPTTSSRQPVSAASPLSQRTSILNKEAERLMERVRSISSGGENQPPPPTSSIWPSSQNQPKLTRPVLPPGRPVLAKMPAPRQPFDEEGMLGQMELQVTMQKLLEGALLKANDLEVSEDVAAMIQAEQEEEARKHEIEAARVRQLEQEEEDREKRRGQAARLSIILKRWQNLSDTSRRRRAIAVRAIHLRRLLPFLNAWLQMVEEVKRERVEATEEARKGMIADKFRRLFLLNVALAAWRDLVEEGGMRRLEEAKMRRQAQVEEREMAAKEILALRFHRLFILHNSVTAWRLLAKAGREERERLKLEAVRKERITSLLSRIAAKDHQAETQPDVAVTEPSIPTVIPIASPSPPPLTSRNQASFAQPSRAAVIKRPVSAATKPCAPRLSTALRAEERKKSILSGAGIVKPPVVAIHPTSPISTLVTATPASLEISHQTTPGKTYAMVQSMKKQLKQGGPVTISSQDPSEPWPGAYDVEDHLSADVSDQGYLKAPVEQLEAPVNNADHLPLRPPSSSRPRTSASSVSSVVHAPSSFGSKVSIVKAPSFDPRPPVSSRRMTASSVASSARSDLGSICSSASAMEKKREVEEALAKAKALEAKKRRKVTAQLVEVEGAFEKEASALSRLHYHRSLLIRAIRQWRHYSALCLINLPMLSIRHHHRSLMKKSILSLALSVQSRRWQEVMRTAVGIASLRLSSQNQLAKKCIQALSQWTMVSRFSKHHLLQRVMDSLHLMTAIGREKVKIAKIFHAEMIQRLSFASWRQAAEEQGSKRLLARLQEQHEQQRKAGQIVLSYCFKRWRASLPELRVDRQACQRAHSMRSKVSGWLQEMRAKREPEGPPADIDLRFDDIDIMHQGKDQMSSLLDI